MEIGPTVNPFFSAISHTNWVVPEGEFPKDKHEPRLASERENCACRM